MKTWTIAIDCLLLFTLPLRGQTQAVNWSKGVFGRQINVGRRAFVIYIVGETTVIITLAVHFPTRPQGRCRLLEQEISLESFTQKRSFLSRQLKTDLGEKWQPWHLPVGTRHS